MPNVFVSLIEPGQKRRQSVVNGKDGRFRFVRLQKKAYDVSVQLWSPPKGAAPVEAREVWPDTGELELTAAFDSPKKQAKGSVRGTVSDAAGRLDSPGALAVILAMNHRSWTTDANLEGAQFHFEDIEPGSVQVVVMNGDDPILVGPWFELQPAEHKDVGTLVTEPGGKLLLNLVRQPGTEALEPGFSFLLAGAMHPRRVTAGKGVTELAIDNLCVGEHRITAYSKGMASIRSKCTIVAGGEARASIELRAAASREIVVEYAPDQRVTHIRVQVANGAEVYDFAQAGMLDRPYRQKLQLPLGRFTFLVETEGGGVAQREFEMTSLAEDQPPVVLQAK
ncbi:MAG TPA: hypothetical protein VFD82_00060, partial [Planctomycetota bacterium]|nr:hypothetical protein [Planctomycetota bacterium]